MSPNDTQRCLASVVAEGNRTGLRNAPTDARNRSMTDPAELVRRFYEDVWNRADGRAARTLLDRGLRFRGSLGPQRVGPDGFIDYMRSVHAALGG